MYIQKLHHFCNTSSPDDGPKSQAQNTSEITNNGRFINQSPSNIIRSIRQFERINKIICRQKNIYYVQSNIYIVIHREICFVLSELISVARQYLPVDWDQNPVYSNVKPKLLTIQPRGDISCEVNFKQLWITITIVYIHPFNGSRDLNSTTKRLAIDANGNTITSLPENSTPRG